MADAGNVEVRIRAFECRSIQGFDCVLSMTCSVGVDYKDGLPPLSVSKIHMTAA